MASRSALSLLPCALTLAILAPSCKKSPDPTTGPDGGHASSSATTPTGSIGAGSPTASAAPPTDGGPEYQQACYAFAKARCTKHSSCSKLGFDLTEGLLPSCLSRRTASCLHEYAPKDGSILPAAIDTCARAWEAVSCADLKKSTSLKGCEHAPGKLAEGKACTFDAQCATQFCSHPQAAKCGKCEAAPKAGDACKDGRCGDDPALACVDKLCVKKAAKDAACAGAGGCEGALVCHDKKCVFAGATGAKCDPAGTSAPACDASEGLACDKASSTCKALAALGPNEPCGDGAPGKQCRGDSACKDGKCISLAKPEATCSDAKPCVAPLQCTDGKCRMADPASCP
jgi:hypothetical protein